MKILIINNHTKHINELRQLFEWYAQVVVVDKQELESDYPYHDFSLLVLSWGSDYSVKDHTDYYKHELWIISFLSIPIIWICLGAELIAFAYGGNLKKLNTKLESLLPLRFVSHALAFDQAKVIERHSRVIESLWDELESLAQSNFWYEIIKHKTKPIYGLQFHPEIDPSHQEGDNIVDSIMSHLGYEKSNYVHNYKWV